MRACCIHSAYLAALARDPIENSHYLSFILYHSSLWLVQWFEEIPLALAELLRERRLGDTQ